MVMTATLTMKATMKSVNKTTAILANSIKPEALLLLLLLLLLLMTTTTTMIKESASSAPGRLKPKMAPYRDTMDQQSRQTATLIIIMMMLMIMMMMLIIIIMIMMMMTMVMMMDPMDQQNRHLDHYHDDDAEGDHILIF